MASHAENVSIWWLHHGHWINNNIHSSQWGVITHQCRNFNGGLAKPPLKLGHVWVITSHCFAWMLSLINTPSLMLVKLCSVSKRDHWWFLCKRRVQFLVATMLHDSLIQQVRSGARPTNGISIEFEIRPNFVVLQFKKYTTDHNEIVHTSRQCNCRDVCKISLWSVEYISN